MTNRTPALFLGHGNPMNVLDANNPFNQGFSQIATTFTKPKAILMISAHWYIADLQVQSAATPEVIYDFYGFPQALYQVQYPAKGSPALAARIMELLADDGISADATRGYDHGMWTVLKYLYPDADVPVVQLSINHTKPAKWHYALAKKLAVLRDEGVLIIGSGDIVHNLRLVDWQHINTLGAGYDWAFEFQTSINAAVLNHAHDTLINYQALGDAARLSIPTPEHYLPLLYVMATATADDKIHLFNDALVGGALSMTSIKVG